jgi:hypothetical protein
MSERRSYPVASTATPDEVTCETWVTSDEDEPFLRSLLEASGIDLGKPSLDGAIAGARPPALGPAALDTMLGDDEGRLYRHEQWILRRTINEV